MPAPVLGSIGLGLVWGSLLVMLAWPEREQPWRAILALGAASLLLAIGIYALVGLAPVVGLGVAAALASVAGLAARLDLLRRSGPEP